MGVFRKSCRKSSFHTLKKLVYHEFTYTLRKKIGEVPRGHKRKKSGHDSDDENGMIDRFRRGEDTPSDYEIESKSDDEDEEMNLNQR